MAIKSSLLMSSLVVALAACGGSGEAKQTASNSEIAASVTADTRLVAALIYADWCGSCRTLDPKVETAKAAGEIDGAVFVTLNYTDRDTAAFFASANAAGVGPAIETKFSDTVKTGQLLRIDLDDQEIVGVITKDATPEEITASVSDAAVGA